jgi:hypothetical protein
MVSTHRRDAPRELLGPRAPRQARASQATASRPGAGACPGPRPWSRAGRVRRAARRRAVLPRACPNDVARRRGSRATGYAFDCRPGGGLPRSVAARARLCPGLRRLRRHLHAGEWGGAAQVRRALAVEPARIAHGAPAADDPALMAELRRRGTTLDLCPTSNTQAGIFPSYAAHPLPRLVRAGDAEHRRSDRRGAMTFIRRLRARAASASMRSSARPARPEVAFLHDYRRCLPPGGVRRSQLPSRCSRPPSAGLPRAKRRGSPPARRRRGIRRCGGRHGQQGRGRTPVIISTERPRVRGADVGLLPVADDHRGAGGCLPWLPRLEHAPRLPTTTSGSRSTATASAANDGARASHQAIRARVDRITVRGHEAPRDGSPGGDAQALVAEGEVDPTTTTSGRVARLWASAPRCGCRRRAASRASPGPPKTMAQRVRPAREQRRGLRAVTTASGVTRPSAGALPTVRCQRELFRRRRPRRWRRPEPLAARACRGRTAVDDVEVVMRSTMVGR